MSEYDQKSLTSELLFIKSPSNRDLEQHNSKRNCII